MNVNVKRLFTEENDSKNDLAKQYKLSGRYLKYVELRSLGHKQTSKKPIMELIYKPYCFILFPFKCFKTLLDSLVKYMLIFLLFTGTMFIFSNQNNQAVSAETVVGFLLIFAFWFTICRPFFSSLLNKKKISEIASAHEWLTQNITDTENYTNFIYSIIKNQFSLNIAKNRYYIKSSISLCEAKSNILLDSFLRRILNIQG